MKKFIIFTGIFILSFPFSLDSQTQYEFRVMLKDKGITTYSINNPEEFLSERAIERRIKQKIAIDETDLPIADDYIEQLENLDCKVIAKSRWLSSVAIHTQDSSVVDLVKDLPFVKDAFLVWFSKSPVKKYLVPLNMRTEKPKTGMSDFYGQAFQQITLNNGHKLHEAGFKGQGMQVAVIDAGYNSKNSVEGMNAKILGVKDFVYEGGDIYLSSIHGANVLSCMASNMPDFFVGTAPEAGYWLLRSEDTSSEFPIEEDYWVAAAEFADSVGVDIINTSLGYSTFDKGLLNYTYSQMDGETAYITKGAEMAAEKGIFVCVSAGNERGKSWQKITAPSDAKSVLTVGAVGKDSIYANFSSQGPSADFRIKPDVMSMGKNVSIIDTDTNVVTGSGTSFSSPIMCGMAACLWQAYPDLTNMELLDIIKRSSNRYEIPDYDYGYGLPDMEKAMKLADQKGNSVSEDKINSRHFSFYSDSMGSFVVGYLGNSDEVFIIKVYSLYGKELINTTFSHNKRIHTDQSQKDVYIIFIQGSNFTETIKMCF